MANTASDYNSELREFSSPVTTTEFKTFGIFALLLGVLMLVLPVVSTLAIELMFGVIFVVAGASQVAHAFWSTKWKGTLPAILVGGLYLVTGLFLLFNPFQGAVALTAVLGILFVLEGIFSVFIGTQLPKGFRLWSSLSGAFALLLGMALLVALPQIGTYALGILVGVNFLMTGVAALSLGSAPLK